jgi:acyl dehydratase
VSLDPVPVNSRGSVEHPFVGLPDLSDPMPYGDADLSALLGRDFASAWFTVNPEAEAAFVRGTFLDRIYQGLDAESIVEGFYLLALLDPLLASVVRHRDKQDSALNYGLDRTRFTTPVHMRDVLRAIFTLGKVSARPSGQLVRWRCVVEVSGRTRPALVTDWLMFLPTEEAP